MAYAHGFGYGFGFGFINLLGTLLFFFALVWLFRTFARGYRANGYGRRHLMSHGGDDDAVRTARDRFARGDIGQEEFDRLRDGLAPKSRSWDGPRWFGEGDRALETARLRFAQGEISLEEFEALSKALR